MNLKINWNDWAVLIVLLCATISILSNNSCIKIIFGIAEIIIVWISIIAMAIITKKKIENLKEKWKNLKIK